MSFDREALDAHLALRAAHAEADTYLRSQGIDLWRLGSWTDAQRIALAEAVRTIRGDHS